jgi:hypothetical protein
VHSISAVRGWVDVPWLSHLIVVEKLCNSPSCILLYQLALNSSLWWYQYVSRHVHKRLLYVLNIILYFYTGPTMYIFM